MSARILKWVGGTLFAGTAIGMSVYFARVGLERADQAASVISAFVALAGLALAIYAMVRDRRAGEQAPAAGGPSEVRNTISGGTFHGPVTQGRDFDQIALGSPPPRSSDEPGSTTAG
ncbi:hypothetical protein [Nonomuraea sp. NPDC046570]|uniref:hypothetical protein n=1 Tax=Nonomuraea sp. NPDC046570 TaxID=3155255 RepID=UPI003403899A